MVTTVQQYADQLQSEMIKRGLEQSPIEWPQEVARKHRVVIDEDGPKSDWKVADDRAACPPRAFDRPPLAGTSDADIALVFEMRRT